MDRGPFDHSSFHVNIAQIPHGRFLPSIGIVDNIGPLLLTSFHGLRREDIDAILRRVLGADKRRQICKRVDWFRFFQLSDFVTVA